MADIVGIVVDKKGERARVKIDMERTTVKKIGSYADVWNPAGANVGDRVELDYKEVTKKHGNFVVYGFPILGILAGGVSGNSLAIFFKWETPWYAMLGGALLWGGVAYNYAKIFNRDAFRAGQQLTVIRVEPMEFVINMGKTEDEQEGNEE